MLTQDQFPDVLGQPVHGPDGDKIGKVAQIFVNPANGAASWITVQMGLFGNKETFIPAEDAVLADRGLTVPYTKDAVKNAPTFDADQGQLSQSEEAELRDHYGAGSSQPRDERPAAGTADVSPATDDSGAGATEETMTLSEEQLNVGTETVESGRAAIRKNVVTEEQTVTVPVSHEEARIEREPISEDNRAGRATGELSEGEQEIVLTEERVVVTKETVPVEQVRLTKETVTEDQQVTETVGREELETDPADLNRATDAGDDQV